ncbi:hypothetical protein ACFV90_36975 [Streptomyces sp. NPDC059904]|uniref:hypothetical protein n=1 Tax=Streptomyces sp. NPDC059904 TaxID=3346996 RepID=UPI00364C4884
MTAIATEPAAALADLPSAPVTAEPVILPGLLTGLGVTQRPTIPAWITDPDAIESILSGVYELPDFLTEGGTR